MVLKLTTREAAWLRSLVQRAVHEQAHQWAQAVQYYRADTEISPAWRAAMHQAADNVALCGLLLDKLREPILLPWKPETEEAEEDEGEEWKEPVA